MRHCLLVFLIACGGSGPKTTVPAPPATGGDTPVSVEEPKPPEPAGEVLAADTPKATVAGNTFIAPAGWRFVVRGAATILTAPEGDSHVVLVDVQAKDAVEAIALGWAAYGKTPAWSMHAETHPPDHEGWTKAHMVGYATSPSEKRDVTAQARFANGTWTVVIYDVTTAVGQKRNSQLQLVFGQLLPKGSARESFAGKKANVLDKAHIAELTKFITDGMKTLDVPGAALGLIQDGKVVFASGFGVREIGRPVKVDGDTRFMIASNTKALTTLMLAKLVDEGKLAWDQPVTAVLPQFKLGDADTTSKVLVKHLMCACTGLPRQDMESLFEWQRNDTAEKVLVALGKMQPTTRFGELFQYSNAMAAAAGFTGAHIAFPELELGKAYDEAMRTRVFAPLGMASATFDFKRAQTGNFAVAHVEDVHGKTRIGSRTWNERWIPMRPAAGAWVSLNDMLKYVQMELAEGKLPGGKRYIGKDALVARRAPQVAIGKGVSYGMGLYIVTYFGITYIDHGGAAGGFHSNMIWFPEYGVGAVIMVNSDSGSPLTSLFSRKLLEVLFDGVKEADPVFAANLTQRAKEFDAVKVSLEIPADDAKASKLAAKYTNASLGDIIVSRKNKVTTFDFGEWKSEMATKKNSDDTTSFVTIATGIAFIELLQGTTITGKRTLTLLEGQHEYVFTEQ